MVTALKSLLTPAAAFVRPYFVHASGQALAWMVLATHNPTKWEAGAAVVGTAVLTSLVKKISAWLAKPAV